MRCCSCWLDVQKHFWMEWWRSGSGAWNWLLRATAKQLLLFLAGQCSSRRRKRRRSRKQNCSDQDEDWGCCQRERIVFLRLCARRRGWYFICDWERKHGQCFWRFGEAETERSQRSKFSCRGKNSAPLRNLCSQHWKDRIAMLKKKQSKK